MTALPSLPHFFPGAQVLVTGSCLRGDVRLIGKRGTVVRVTPAGGILVKFGSFWRARVETCFPEELEVVAR